MLVPQMWRCGEECHRRPTVDHTVQRPAPADRLREDRFSEDRLSADRVGSPDSLIRMLMASRIR